MGRVPLRMRLLGSAMHAAALPAAAAPPRPRAPRSAPAARSCRSSATSCASARPSCAWLGGHGPPAAPAALHRRAARLAGTGCAGSGAGRTAWASRAGCRPGGSSPPAGLVGGGRMRACGPSGCAARPAAGMLAAAARCCCSLPTHLVIHEEVEHRGHLALLVPPGCGHHRVRTHARISAGGSRARMRPGCVPTQRAHPQHPPPAGCVRERAAAWPAPPAPARRRTKAHVPRACPTHLQTSGTRWPSSQRPCPCAPPC